MQVDTGLHSSACKGVSTFFFLSKSCAHREHRLACANSLAAPPAAPRDRHTHMPKDLPPCPYWDAAPVVCEHWHDPPPRAPIDWVRVVAGGVAVVALVLLLLMTCVERKRRNEYAMAVATDGPEQLENGSARRRQNGGEEGKGLVSR